MKLTALIFSLVGGLIGLFFASQSIQSYNSQATIWFSDTQPIESEVGLIESDAFAKTFTAFSPTISATRDGRVMHISVSSQSDQIHALRIAAAYINYRNGIMGQSPHTAIRKKPVSAPTEQAIEAARTALIEAQIALRDGQMHNDMPVAPIILDHPIATSVKERLERQNVAIATAQYERNGRLDGIQADVLSPLYHSLIAQLVDLNSQLAGERVTYGNRHPNIIKLKRQIYSVEGALKAESQLILNRMTASLPSVQTAPQPNKTTPPVTKAADLTHLQIAVKEAQKQYASLMKQYDAAQAIGAPTIAKASLLSDADTVTHQIKRPYLTYSLLGIIGGLTLTILLGLMRIIYQPRLRSTKALEQTTELPVYAMIPEMRRGKKTDILDQLLVNSNDALAESLRHIRTQMRLRHKGLETPRVVAVTSALPNEGKTTLAAMLATICAQAGDRVLIIDADLRRPCVHKLFATDQKAGLVDTLTDRFKLNDAIDKTHETGVHILNARATPSHALALIDSAKFWQMLREVRGDYDLVLVDTPSLLNFSDALILANLSDLTLFVTRWGGIPAKRVAQAIALLKGVKTTPMASILTRVKGNNHRKLGGYANYNSTTKR